MPRDEIFESLDVYIPSCQTMLCLLISALILVKGFFHSLFSVVVVVVFLFVLFKVISLFKKIPRHGAKVLYSVL